MGAGVFVIPRRAMARVILLGGWWWGGALRYGLGWVGLGIVVEVGLPFVGALRGSVVVVVRGWWDVERHGQRWRSFYSECHDAEVRLKHDWVLFAWWALDSFCN